MGWSRGARQAREAFRLLRRRPVRLAMSAASVAVSVATIVVAVTSAERARANALEEIRRMGADVLVVDAATSRSVAGRSRASGVVRTLTESDARDIAEQVPGIALIAAEYRGTVPMKVGNLARQVTVSGDESSYALLRGGTVQGGRFFSREEEVASQRVAVIGARIAADLFAEMDPVGATMRLGGVTFVVVGVLGERGTGVDAFDEDQVVFVPLRTARRRLFNVEHVQRIFVRAAPETPLDELAAAITNRLALRHPRRTGDSLDFRVRDQRRLIEMRQGAADRLRMFQVSLTAVMLIAGAGGTFGLQLLSVRERRAEIGVRRALGARRDEVFSQFAIEAAVASVLGAVVGLTIAFGGTATLRATFPTALAMFATAAGFAVSLIASGIAALGAARLPAAQALRLR